MNDGYGSRRDPFDGSADYHPGLDISADRGDPVVATANGTVSSAQRSGAYGNMIVIDHGFGISTRYAHLDSFRVKPGDAVRRGDVIGYAGSTGRSTGSHLHYEVLVYGRHLNPLQFLLEPRAAVSRSAVAGAPLGLTAPPSGGYNRWIPA